MLVSTPTEKLWASALLKVWTNLWTGSKITQSQKKSFLKIIGSTQEFLTLSQKCELLNLLVTSKGMLANAEFPSTNKETLTSLLDSAILECTKYITADVNELST